MARIEKTVFISYRRTDVYTALAVYENVKNQGYDVFFDYRSVSSGDFEQIITSNIRARAHFLLILTPTALDRCNEPGDWLRREIEFAIDERRNIIPLFFRGFRFGDLSVTEKLTGKLRNVSRYNGLNVHEDYFDEAMHRLRTQYLNIPLNTVLHPVSTEVRKVVQEEKLAADHALEQIEDVKELVKQPEKTPDLPIAEPYPKQTVSTARDVGKSPVLNTRFNISLIGGIVGGLLILSLLIWGASKFFSNLSAAPGPTQTLLTSVSSSPQPSATITPQTSKTNTPSPTQTSIALSQTTIPQNSSLGIGSTMISEKDGMTLLYVPAGDFIMGSDNGEENEKPVHTVYLDAFWIDQTEVTNKMYSFCVQAGGCTEPLYQYSRPYGNSNYDNYPIRIVEWNMAKTYCEWANRRLPTEAEWEKAARGTDGQMYPWGKEEPNSIYFGNFNHSAGDTTEVGSYPYGASPYGALDMAGNVSEWVADWYSDTYYASSPKFNPLGPASGQFKVVRGGFWAHDPYFSPSADRESASSGGSDSVGFRCAMDATL